MAARTRPALVGRGTELAELEAALAGAAAGTPALVIVDGEAGIGKTRLVEELGERARGVGATVLVGNCLDLGEGRIPFAPMTQMLRTLAHERDRSELERILGPVRAELSRLVPAIGGDTGSPATLEEVTGQVGRARLFESILGAIDRLGRETPLLLVFEDVHWIDDASRDLVTFLARNLSRERVLSVLTHRSNEVPRSDRMDNYLAELRRVPAVQRIGLRPLASEEARALIAELAGRPPADEVWHWVAALAEGNPLFIEELLAARQGGQQTVPDTLRGTILGPVQRLSPAARRVLDVAAVAGRPLDERTLGPATELDQHLVLAAIREAVAAPVLVATEDAYAVRHVLLREAVRDDLLPGEKRRIHERLAEILAGRPETDASSAAEVALHWAGADRPIEAMAASLRAAAAAESVYAFGEALRHYETVLELWGRVPADDTPSVGQVEVLRRAAESANLAGEPTRAMHLVELALATCDPGAVVTRGLLHGRLGYLQWLSGENEAAIASHREAVRLVPEEPATMERARVLGGLAGALMGAGRYRESVTIAEDAIASARESASVGEEAHGLNILGSDLVSLGDVEAGLGHLERALELARSGAVDARIVAYHNLAFALEQSDRLELGLQQAADAIQLLRESGLERRFGTRLRAVAGECLFRLGRWDEADAITREGLELRAPPDRARYLLGVRGELLVGRGDVEEARRLLAVAGGAITSHVDPDLQAFVAARQAELALHDRRWQDAREAVARGLWALGESGIVSLTALLYALGIRIEAERFGEARVRRDPSEADRAREHAERLRQRILEPAADGDPDGDRAARAWRATAHAEMAVFGGTTDAAAWAAVAAAWDGIPSPYPAAYARLREASALLATGGDRSAAAASLHQAWDTARALRATPLQSAIEGLAQRARIPAPATTDVAAAASGSTSRAAVLDDADAGTRLGLSARESEVLRLLALGRTNGQIALELFITPKTASVHVTHILVKLGVTNRVEAAMIAARAGLADHPGQLAGT